LENRISAQKNVVQQKIQEMEEIQQRISKNKKYLVILKEKIDISSNLLKDDLSNRLDHLKYLEQKIGIEGKINEDFWSLERSKTSVKEARLRIQSLRDAHKETALSEYNDKNNAYEELSFRRKQLLDNRSRTMIRSPVNGRVKYLYYSTIGGVISPGAVVLEVVPEAGKLIVEAKLPVNEKAYVRLGQRAKVRLTAPGPAGFGQLDGRVDYISADSILDKTGATYFLVRVSVEGKNVSYNGKTYELASGESVECRILIGERRIIDYFIEPFWKGADMALRER
jgi:adhesin transport system membrane fusion protein